MSKPVCPHCGNDDPERMKLTFVPAVTEEDIRKRMVDAYNAWHDELYEYVWRLRKAAEKGKKLPEEPHSLGCYTQPEWRTQPDRAHVKAICGRCSAPFRVDQTSITVSLESSPTYFTSAGVTAR